MKNFKSLVLLALTLCYTYAHAQGTASVSGNILQAIVPDSLELSHSLTTNILFPFDVVSADRGSRDVLVQKAKGTGNILQLKAAQACFEPTNLSVVTTDGALYTFILHYNEYPEKSSITVNMAPGSAYASLPGGVNKAEIVNSARLAAGSLNGRRGRKANAYGMAMVTDGIYVQNDVMYLRLTFTNTSEINYGIETLRFFVKDQKKAKRTSSQEVDVNPIYIHNAIESIPHDSGQVFVIALPKFTIPDKKIFCIQLMEKNGGRHLQLQLKHRDIFNALPLHK